MLKNPKDYCLVLCRRMAYFMLMLYKLELVRMEAEFGRDDNGKVWFTYATKILLAPANLNDIDEDLMIQSLGLVRTQEK
jgi:hypothetical protein